MDEIFDAEAPLPEAVVQTAATLRAGAKTAFLSRLLFLLSVEVIYEYYITFNFFGLVLRGLQVVRLISQQCFLPFRRLCVRILSI
jgi:hypothetical protein